MNFSISKKCMSSAKGNASEMVLATTIIWMTLVQVPEFVAVGCPTCSKATSIPNGSEISKILNPNYNLRDVVDKYLKCNCRLSSTHHFHQLPNWNQRNARTTATSSQMQSWSVLVAMASHIANLVGLLYTTKER
jgi:hypothetical protein